MINENTIKSFKDFFKGRTDDFAEQIETGKYHRLGRRMEDKDIGDHLSGSKSYGMYLISPENNTCWHTVIDIDVLDEAVLKKVIEAVLYIGIERKQILVEFSGGKGYHIWIGFENAVEASKARNLGQIVLTLTKIKEKVEIFPKQERIEKDGYGSLIKLPLGIHKKAGKSSYFLDNDLKPIERWQDYLKAVKKVDNRQVESILKQFGDVIVDKPVISKNEHQNLPCFKSIMETGVSEGKRDNIAFKLAIYLKNQGITPGLILTMLREWNKQNKPPLNGHEIIAKLKSAYSHGYTNYGCDEEYMQEFCNPEICPLKKDTANKNRVEINIPKEEPVYIDKTQKEELMNQEHAYGKVSSDMTRKVIKIEVNHSKVAEKIRQEHKLIFHEGDFHGYRQGYYQLLTEIDVKRYIKDFLQDGYSKHRANEIIELLIIDSSIDAERVNIPNKLNLKNCMIDLVEGHRCIDYDHAPEFYSTIQLDVNFNPDAKCNKWLKTLDEIFIGNKNKINLLQEYFGLCLTRETKYQKALFLVGEGNNGKSTILFILQHILGEKNYISIPLEKLQDLHYVASLAGKLANITIETHAKSSVYDSIFKAIVSGDPLTADRKYGHPFTFKPFCKLIFAVNTMPRVDDKTDAFYRRLLILNFERKFEGEEDNKKLKIELLNEIDGIFLWALEGLERLTKNGNFTISADMQQEIEAYRRENNNVLVFVDETCKIDESYTTTKHILYESYNNWCKKSGYRPLSIYNFGKELKKHYPSVKEDRTAGKRFWTGIFIR
jgi:P4 family phage/plasmid primase-like protien